MIPFYFFILVLSQCSGGSAVEGGTEAGNPPAAARTVTGTVPSSTEAALGLPQAAADDCVADTVIVTDTSAQTTSASVADDCTFTLTLDADKSYALSLALGENIVAALLFNNGDGLLGSPYMRIARGDSVIDLGSISVSGRVGRPQNEPARQNDRDGNGIDDFDDDDDDGDGTRDEDEEDCDLDGLWDDDDDSDCNDEDSDDSGSAQTIEVHPRNDTNLNDNRGLVEVDQEVEVRLSCDLDPDSINATTVVIQSEGGHVIECEFDIEDDRFSCEHEDNPFQPDEVYTATLSGLRCANGAIVTNAEWSWKTEED